LPRSHRRPRSVRIALLAVALLAGGLTLSGVPAGAAEGQAEGIDVSHWQGTINWSRVAGAGKTFAFLKASQGTSYRDATYATNRANANAAGIPIGAYHFADVTKSPSNAAGARAEADWFVSVAQPRAGDLPPVFDIETNNGLGQVALTDWAMVWLERVRQLTGIYPMIYTSPSPWTTRFGTSGNVIPESGYGLLWVAHYTTASSPTVPANNWAGNGWTFWQYTSSGTVSGISGNVDLDRYEAADVTPLLLRQLTIAKSSVAGRFGGVEQDGLGGFCNASCSATTRLSVGGATTTLTPQSTDLTTTWVWGGDCAGTANGAPCTLSMTADRDVTITYQPATVPVTVAAAGTGSGSVASDPAGITCAAAAGVASGTCTAPFTYTSTVTLTATPAAGSVFGGWSGACTGTGTCTLAADAAKTATATFTAVSTAALTLTRSGMGTGSVTPSGGTACAATCSTTYPIGTNLTVTQSAGSGSVFVGWTGGTCTGTGTCTVTMDGARTVIGWFAPLYARTVSLRASSTRVASGTAITLSGTVGSTNTSWCTVGGQTVTVTVGSTVVGTATTAVNGAWSIPLAPTVTATYVARLGRTDPATLGNPVCGAANSSSVKVTVR
jgi:GH25 family lysozyme M1 (1,4-beta-N-acetylmuramidase)